nr:transporter [uncultured Mediterraneibacter sp.]
MRRISPGIIVVFVFLAMLFSPQEVFNGASEGLLLWFQIIIPTLFPFMLVSNLMLASGGLSIVARLSGGISRAIFGTSENGSFAVLAGFLCGYPMGAKVSADLLRANKITEQEAGYLLSFCNNTSPVFIINYIVWKSLGKEELLAPTLIILFIVPMLLSLVFRRYYLKGKKFFENVDLQEMPGRKFNLGLVDECMMNSFESIVKVGGYIILFSILISLLNGILSRNCPVFLLPAILEITNGIRMIAENIQNITVSYPLILGITTFGGLCAAAQTSCMLEGTGIKMLPYLIEKLAAALAASLIGYLYIYTVTCTV